MATPTRATIIAAINTKLSAIAVSGGYKTDVTTVENLIKDWQDVTATLRPWLGINAMRETYKMESFNSIWATMRVGIGGHVQGNTKALANTAMVNLEDDVIAAMFSDPTLGENAVDVTLLTGWDDQADPDTEIGGASTGYGGTFYMEFDVMYQRSTGSS